jgi:uncharacterized membrane protein (UPF0127 family)
MKQVLVNNLSRQVEQPVKAVYCTSFLCRLRGLMFRRMLSDLEGLLLVQSKDSRVDSSIHMMFMRFDIGVLWINQAFEIVDVCLARQWRPAYFPKYPARYTLEMRPERLNDYQIGDKVQFDEIEMD